MPFEFTCPHCHTRTKVHDKYIGQSGPCATCGRVVVMPTRNAQGVLVASLQPSAQKKSSDNRKSPKARLIPAIAGIVLASSLLIGGTILAVGLLPNFRKGFERVALKADLDNMAAIAKALNQYADRHGTYPTPSVTDANGKPLYSWRVLILPFLGYEDLYKRFELSQAWDSPANSNLLREIPKQYASPNSADAYQNFETNYALITGPGTLFPSAGPLDPRTISDKPTLLLVETSNGGCVWSQPGDIDAVLGLKIGTDSMKEIGGLHKNYITAVSTDADPLKLPVTIPRIVLDGLVSPNGGEQVETKPYTE